MLANCKLVLMRPRDPNNIGAAARAMKNFGFRELWLVAPYAPVWREAVSAVNALDVLKQARIATTLDEAVSDCNLIVGTTDRTRVEPKQALYTPTDLRRELREAEYQLALVFGSEKHGLTNEDLSRCHRILSVPTEPDCPSLNLGQAVAICCYELSRAQATITPPASAAATVGTIAATLQLALDVLHLVDFVLPGAEAVLTRRLRSSLLRSNLTEHDASTLCGILSRLKRALRRTT